MSASIVFGREIRTGRVVHIENVVKEEHEIYECCGCGISLSPVKSVARKKDCHFRHKETANIASCRSTALHDFAVQLIVDNTSIVISKGVCISYENPRIEVTVLNKRSDVTVLYGDVDVHFEVVVTHDLDQEKIELYMQHKIHCIKIDLSHPNWLTASPDTINDIVFFQPDNKIKIYWPDEVDTIPTSAGGFSIGAIILGVLAAIALAIQFFRKMKRRRRR